mmetsp:Transcript_102843/g.286376  ORF Transcript_102843/g.286376 Transcript_102843/m.286376 type:complete len:296 (-) Transcript_102843:661-1548(-)
MRLQRHGETVKVLQLLRRLPALEEAIGHSLKPVHKVLELGTLHQTGEAADPHSHAQEEGETCGVLEDGELRVLHVDLDNRLLLRVGQQSLLLGQQRPLPAAIKKCSTVRRAAVTAGLLGKHGLVDLTEANEVVLACAKAFERVVEYLHLQEVAVAVAHFRAHGVRREAAPRLAQTLQKDLSVHLLRHEGQEVQALQGAPLATQQEAREIARGRKYVQSGIQLHHDVVKGAQQCVPCGLPLRRGLRFEVLAVPHRDLDLQEAHEAADQQDVHDFDQGNVDQVEGFGGHQGPRHAGE